MYAVFSFAPPGLVLSLLPTHGLRRGLHSFAASRLRLCVFLPTAFAVGCTLSPLRGCVCACAYPTACAVGCTLSPLRGLASC